MSLPRSLLLYGIHALNYCIKKKMSQKVVNTLLPFSYGLWAQSQGKTIQTFQNDAMVPYPEVLKDYKIETEVSDRSSDHFIQCPPQDVKITHKESGVSHYYESKVVMYKGNQTEIILRQDCYSFNCLRCVLENNKKSYSSLDELLSDPELIEAPYLWMLLWKDTEDIEMDLVVLSDITLLGMIHSSKSARSTESVELINKALNQHYTTGKMIYKENKNSTVPHQKVSLTPLRDFMFTRAIHISFETKAKDLVLDSVIPDKNLWQEIEKAKLHARIRELEEELARHRESMTV